jgi:hypothetical protein
VQLQQELKKVEAVIDNVVDTHHLGFNHAIERYSKIIALFNECKAQVTPFKRHCVCGRAAVVPQLRHWHSCPCRLLH